MIRVFIDGPIAGDVRTDFPAKLGPTIKVPIPRMVTTCDCDDPYRPAEDFEFGPEVVEYHSIASGPQLAIMSSSADRGDKALMQVMNSWVQSDLSMEVWRRHCRDRNAWARAGGRR